MLLKREKEREEKKEKTARKESLPVEEASSQRKRSLPRETRSHLIEKVKRIFGLLRVSARVLGALAAALGRALGFTEVSAASSELQLAFLAKFDEILLRFDENRKI